MDKKLKWNLTRIFISSILLVIASFYKFNFDMCNIIIYIIAYIIVGYDVILNALRNIFRGKLFDENFLMSIATIGAFCINVFPEAVAVMLFYQIGELFQDYALDKSRKSIASLIDIRTDYANVYHNDKLKQVNPRSVDVGDVILIKPGEKIPLDGIVIDGESMLDTYALTGEAVLKKVRVNDEVLSGCINNGEILKVKVLKEFKESTVSKIMDMVENASNRKSKSENFINKFATYYTPIVVIIAVLLAVFPPLIIEKATFSNWIYRALSFLVVSCPCALVISIPLSFFGGIAAASKIGVLIKGGNYLEALSKVDVIVCDKTATITEGVFKVQKINPINYSSDELLKYAVHAEWFSNHPISFSLKKAYNRKINEKLITKTKEFSGKGVFANVEGNNVLVGNKKLMIENKIKFKESDDIGTIVYVAINNEFAGTILISDRIKDDSYSAIKLLKSINIKKLIMLTGDKKDISNYVARELNFDECYAELLPQDKVSILEKIMKQNSDGNVIFVGDGVNDAPVLAIASVGIAMGGIGSDAAIESADIVIMTDELSKIASSIKISKRTMHIVKQNIIFAITVKISILLLNAFGFAGMWVSVFADVGVSLIAIINALRILNRSD